MGRANGRLRVLLLVVAVVSLACSPDPRGQVGSVATSSPPASGSSAAPGPTGSTERFATDCPVTKGGQFRPPPGVSRTALFGSASSYGNGRLWVGGLARRGVIVSDFDQADGSAGMKFGWWRHVRARLTITGRRLDAPAPPLRSSVPSGYGPTGFQSSGVYFPTEGCWEVTGSAGATTLSFVTVVRRRAT